MQSVVLKQQKNKEKAGQLRNYGGQMHRVIKIKLLHKIKIVQILRKKS